MQPMSATHPANASTFGEMPGISAITMTAGPVPRRKTSRVLPSWVKVVFSKSSIVSVAPWAADRSVPRRWPAPRPFRFGVQCSALPGGTRRPRGDAWRALARRVEDLGFSTLTVADHLDDQLAIVPAMQAAADATTTLRVGALVLCNDYRHPVVLAKEVATSTSCPAAASRSASAPAG